MTSDRPRRAAVWWLAVAMVLALLAVGCTSDEAAEPTVTPIPESPEPPEPPEEVPDQPTPGGTLRVASGPLPDDWSPAAQVWDTSARQVARGLYDRLAVYDANGAAVPELAESVESDDDFTTWTIQLRRGVLFHDGTPLDAAAVVGNLEVQRSSPVGEAALTPVESIEATSSLTVVVTMASPWSTFLETLATQIGYVASPGTLLAGGTTDPVGTGPFRMAAAVSEPGAGPGEGGVALERNPFYWQSGLPRLDAVAFSVWDDPTDRVAAVTGGDADLVAASRPVQMARLERAAGRGEVGLVEDRNAEAPKVAVALNTGQAPFDRLAARRAVGLATDRTEMVTKVLDGEGTVARGIISDPSPWFSDLPEPVPDTRRSRGEVSTYADETGETLALELLVPPDPLLGELAHMWRDQQAEVGIEVTLVDVTDAELAERLERGQYQAAIGIGFTSAHPDLYEQLFRGIPGEQPAVNPNRTRYVNPVVTEAFADARATGDVAQQVEEYRIVQEQLFLEVPWLFLVQLRQGVGVGPGVRSVTDWSVASGGAGLGQDGATVSLRQIWLDPEQARDGAEPPAPDGTTSTETPG